jgi:NAD(P)H-hydrate epimerase
LKNIRKPKGVSRMKPISPNTSASLDPSARSIDERYAREHLPPRRPDSHKGSYGKALLVVGSKKYRGAAHLCALGALHSGVGMVTVFAEEAVIGSLVGAIPEAIYTEMPPASLWTGEDIDLVLSAAREADAVLVGPGCGMSEGLYRLVLALLSQDGAPLLLDADAINALAAHRAEAEAALKSARREVLLTPHPLEFSRLSGASVADLQANRAHYARTYAEKWNASVLLKGNGTVIASKEGVAVNTNGSSALSKGGSGDVLSGVVTALIAQGASPYEALSVGAFLHGKAGDALSLTLSEYGVLPSLLPREVAVQINKLLEG